MREGFTIWIKQFFMSSNVNVLLDILIVLDGKLYYTIEVYSKKLNTEGCCMYP